MRSYEVTLKSGKAVKIEAARIVVEWPGVRLEDAEGAIVAVWLGGNVDSVVPADATTIEPVEPDAPDEGDE